MVYFTKALADLEVNYVEDGNETNIINTDGPIEVAEQINTICTYPAPSEYIDSNGGKWTIVPNTSRITIQSGANVLNVKYTKKIPTTNLQIRYIEKNNPTNVLDTVDIGKPQIGTTYNYNAPLTINSGGLWAIDGSADRSYSITESSSVFTIEYTKVMSSIVIKYYDQDNPDVIINTINVPGTYQVGTIYSYTVPSIYNGSWELASGGTNRTYAVVDGSNEILIPYVEEITSTRDVVIKYVERNNWANVLNQIDVGEMNIGDTDYYTVPSTYTYNGEWSLYGVDTNRSYLITADNYEIYVEYEKVMSTGKITINYVEDGNIANVLSTRTVSNKQVGTLYTDTAPDTINVNGEWTLAGSSDISHTVTSSGNVINVPYQKHMSSTPVTIKYIDDESPYNVLNTRNEGYMQIGSTYDYSVPSTYVYDGIWRVLVGGNNRSFTVTDANNEIFVTYTTQMSTAPIVINYVDYENPSIILSSVEIGSRAVGTEYTSTAPDSIDVNGIWKLAGDGEISHLVTDFTNTINVPYQKLMSSVDVVIKYVEYADHQNVLTSMDVGQMQVGSTYHFSVSNTFDHGGIWDLVGSTLRTYIVTEDNNDVLVEYTPPENLLVPITIKYVDKDDHNTVFDTITVNDVPVSDTYTYNVPATLNSNGSWSVVGNSTGRTYSVQNSNNIIYVEYEKVMAQNVTINYVDENDYQNILDTKNSGPLQVGSVYTYEVPDMVDNNGTWVLTGSTIRTYTVLSSDNEINVEYMELMSQDEVLIRYVEKDNHSHVFSTRSEGSQQVASTFEYTVDATINNSGVWNLYGGDTTRYYVVQDNYNIIYVEYEPAMSGTVTINYVDSTDNTVVLYTTTVPAQQVGTTYSFNVPSTYTDSTGVWTLSGGTSRSATITEGNNVIEVPYVKPVVQAPVIVKYMSDDPVPILLNTAFEGNREVGSTYTHTAPATYTCDGTWQRVGSSDRSLIVQNTTNEIIITYTRVLSTDQVTIQFVDTDGMAIYPANVLTLSSAGYKQVGSVYTYTAPTTYIDNSGRGWQLVGSSNINYNVIQNNNYIVVQYRLVSRPLSSDEVTIKYVEQGNTSNVLKTTIIGQVEIDTIYQSTADSSFTNSQGTWNIVGDTSISYTVLPIGNTIYVYYTRTIANTYVTVSYVNADDDNDILYSEEANTLLYVGQTYPYIVPGSFAGEDGGLWIPSENIPGNYSYAVTLSDNNIIIPFKKEMADITVNYIDYDNPGHIIHTEKVSAQVGTSYSYNALPEYIDVRNGSTLGGNTRAEFIYGCISRE